MIANPYLESLCKDLTLETRNQFEMNWATILQG